MTDLPIAPPKNTAEAMAKPLPFEPQDFSQMWALVNWVKDSGLVPSALRGKPADLLIVFATGRELGLSAMQSMRSLHVVDGKPGMSAELIAARIRRSGACRFLRLVKSDDTEAIYESQRVEDVAPTQVSFTMKDAERMGLAGKDNYRKQPATMLRSRCVSKLGRAMYQDVLFGVYEMSELDDIAETTAPRQVEVVDTTPAKPARSISGIASRAAVADAAVPTSAAALAKQQPLPTTAAVDPFPQVPPVPPPALDGRTELGALVSEARSIEGDIGDDAFTAVCQEHGIGTEDLRSAGLDRMRGLIEDLRAARNRRKS